jgi:hypothetical protein
MQWHLTSFSNVELFHSRHRDKWRLSNYENTGKLSPPSSHMKIKISERRLTELIALSIVTDAEIDERNWWLHNKASIEIWFFSYFWTSPQEDSWPTGKINLSDQCFAGEIYLYRLVSSTLSICNWCYMNFYFLFSSISIPGAVLILKFS